jgi:hypothetical protein
VIRRTLGAVLSAALLAVGAVTSPASAALPSKATWLDDVDAAMAGSSAYVDRRVARGGNHLAVNFDIDNTTLATHYEPAAPVRRVLRFARHAHAEGVTLLWNTARFVGDGRMAKAKRQLQKAGYAVAEVCGRQRGEEIAHSKQRCRAHFVAEGYTLVANVGNRSTDFVGGDYEKAYELPNYGNQLT